MKKFLSFLTKILPHLLLILGFMLLTFFVIDKINPSMAFLNNNLTKTITALFALLAIIHSVIFIISEEKN